MQYGMHTKVDIQEPYVNQYASVYTECSFLTATSSKVLVSSASVHSIAIIFPSGLYLFLCGKLAVSPVCSTYKILISHPDCCPKVPIFLSANQC